MSKPRTAEEALTAEVALLEKQRDSLIEKTKAALAEKDTFERRAGEAIAHAGHLDDERARVQERINARKDALARLALAAAEEEGDA